MSITIRKILHFFNKLRDIKKTFEKVTHFTPLHPTKERKKQPQMRSYWLMLSTILNLKLPIDSINIH